MQHTMVGTKVIATANTGRDGSGATVLIGQLAGPAWLDRISWQSLGDNAACVGRVFAQVAGNPIWLLVAETTLPVKSGTSQTTTIDPVDKDVLKYFAAGTKFHASVSVDLTSSAGYQVSLAFGTHRSDFETT